MQIEDPMLSGIFHIIAPIKEHMGANLWPTSIKIVGPKKVSNFQRQRLLAELLHLSIKEMHGTIRGCIYTKKKTCEN